MANAERSAIEMDKYNRKLPTGKCKTEQGLIYYSIQEKYQTARGFQCVLSMIRKYIMVNVWGKQKNENRRGNL